MPLLCRLALVLDILEKRYNMEFHTILTIFLGNEMLEAYYIFNSLWECSEAMKTLGADPAMQDYDMFCTETNSISTSPRPKARPLEVNLDP